MTNKDKFTDFTLSLFHMVELEGHCQLAKAALALGDSKSFLTNLQQLEDKLKIFKLRYLTSEVITEYFLAVENETAPMIGNQNDK